MPTNPEQEPTLLDKILTKWYWFTNGHKLADIFAALFLGIIIGMVVE